MHPINERFDVADRQFPGARFILTTREIQGWLHSRLRHVEQVQRDAERGAFPWPVPPIDPDGWQRQWHDHHDRVEAYFDGRMNLLVFDVSSGWEPLARFLEVDVPDVPFPRVNVTGSGDGDRGVIPPGRLAARKLRRGLRIAARTFAQ